MMGEFGPWHIAIVLLVFALLFGGKRLPDAARGLGQSMRIFKREMSAAAQPEPAQSPVAEPEPAPTSPAPAQRPADQAAPAIATPVAATPLPAAAAPAHPADHA